jgi:hypothetical protein
MKKLVITQFVILLAGTLFAWINFGFELTNWLHKQACSTGCAIGLTNPFLTPCFYGAIFFLIAFVLAYFILRNLK